MSDMTSRERVLSAINHEVPDRVPVILGVDHATTIMQITPLKRSIQGPTLSWFFFVP